MAKAMVSGPMGVAGKTIERRRWCSQGRRPLRGAIVDSSGGGDGEEMGGKRKRVDQPTSINQAIWHMA